MRSMRWDVIPDCMKKLYGSVAYQEVLAGSDRWSFKATSSTNS